MYNYENPVVPNGYKYVGGEWNNGFMIQDGRGSFWTWIPVDSISGSSDFATKLINWKHNRELEIERDREFLDSGDMIHKYGGIYVSSYDIGRDKRGNPTSVPGIMPWWYKDYDYIKKQASIMGDGVNTFSHLIYSLEWDAILQWLVCSGAKTSHEVFVDSSNWGNYWEVGSAKSLLPTGSSKKFIVNGLADIAGNVWKWTSDEEDVGEHILRGGSFTTNDEKCANAWKVYKDTYKGVHIGARATLVVK